jgi:hypothetical protein
LKEADALYAARYDVTVVTINNDIQQRAYDEALMQSRKWKLRTVNFRKQAPGEKMNWLYLSLKQKGFSFLSRLTLKCRKGNRKSIWWIIDPCRKGESRPIYRASSGGIGRWCRCRPA